MQSLEKANHLKARSGRGAGRGAAAGSGAKFFDFRSDGGELGAEVFVAAVDHFRRMDRAGPLRAERRDHHRHSGADVRAGHRDRVELRLAGDHHPVRVADDRVGSHADQPVREVDPAFEHLLEEHHRAGALGGRDDRTAHHIRRILRPRAIRNLRDVTAEIALDFRLLAAGQDDPVRIKLHRDAEPLEHAAQHPVVAGRGAVHREFSAGRRGQREKAARFDMVARDRVVAAVQFLDAFDFDGVAAGSGDPAAHRVEQLGEVLHVRFPRRVVQGGFAFGGDRRDQDLFGRGYARFVEEKLAAEKPAGSVEAVGFIARHRGTQLDQSVEVPVQAAAADHVAAGREELGGAAAGDQRSGEKDAGPVPGAHFARYLGGPYVAAAEFQHVVFKGEFRPELSGDVQHGAHVEDIGHIAQYALLLGQQQRRDHRQRRVFVAAYRNRTADFRAALHSQTLHEPQLSILLLCHAVNLIPTCLMSTGNMNLPPFLFH